MARTRNFLDLGRKVRSAWAFFTDFVAEAEQLQTWLLSVPCNEPIVRRAIPFLQTMTAIRPKTGKYTDSSNRVRLCSGFSNLTLSILIEFTPHVQKVQTL